MVSLRRALAVFAGLLLAGWALGLRAQDPPARAGLFAPAGVPVEIDTKAGKLAGVFRGATLPMALDYGKMDVSVAKLKTLDVSEKDAGSRTVAATLTDQSHLNGSVAADFAFPVELPGGEVRTVPAADIEQVRFLHPKDRSLAAIVVGLLTLTLMEIILGVDNVIFLAIQAGKLPEERRARARTIGLAFALGTRILLLLTLSFLLGLTKPVFTLPALPLIETMEARNISWRDIILLAGGTFLIYKSVSEMHEKLEAAKGEGEAEQGAKGMPGATFAQVILTIAVIDIVFSLDSVITAVGMVDDVAVMIAAMVVAMLVMLVFAGPIGRFVDSRPTVKVLALSFLILIGVLLIAEGLGQHIDKGYIYFAMAFAVGVEVVNLQLRKKPGGHATPAPASAVPTPMPGAK